MQRILHEFDNKAINQVVEQSPVSIVITDIRGNIEYVNPAFLEITGYSAEELIGENPRILQSGAHDKAFYKKLWGTITKGETWKGELLNKKKDGSLYWESAIISPVYDDDNKIKYYVSTKEDISEKKNANEERMRTEMQFRNLAETAPVLIARVDIKGKLYFHNNYLVNETGKAPETIFDLLCPIAGKDLLKRINKVFAKSVTESLELDCKVNSEEPRKFILKISPNEIGGFVESAIVIAQDISELSEARHQIKKTKDNLFFIAENVADVIWILDTDKKFTFVTPSLNRVTGYTIDEFLDAPFDEFLPDKSIEVFYEIIDRLSELKDTSHIEVWESELRKKDGEIIWIETRSRILLTPEGKYNGVLGVTSDITERKQTQKAILESEVKFRSFFENSNAIILVIDPEKKKVIDANRAATDYYGYEPGEFLKIDVQKELVGLVEAAKVEAAEVLEDFRNVYAQRHRLKNKEYRDVEVLPAKVQVENEVLIYAIIQDVTKRKKAVEALKESESKKLALLKIIPDLIFILNRKGEFVDIYTDNPDRLTIKPYKLLGKPCSVIFPQGLCSALFEKIEEAFESREIQTFEFRYKRDLRNYVIEEIRIIVSGEDEVLAIIRDVTNQRKNEIELKRAWEQAKEASQVKDAFLANISHEIRTPINAVLGFGELLHSELTNTDHLQYIESIQTSSKSLLNLINDLLDLSKIEAGKMTIRQESVNLRMLLNEIESIFSIKLVEKGLDFEINIHDDCPIAMQSDEMRLRQILINLVSNAIKFTPEGMVKVSINAFNSIVVEYVEHVDLKIEVEDTGIGIPDENLQKIFEAFKQQEQQDARKYGGTGLGLTITKRLTELLNGSIQVNSKPGKGSRFTVILYNVEVSQSARTKLATADSVFKIGQLVFESAKLLVADDVKTNRDFLKGIFKGSDISFLEAENGEQAIQLIRENKPRLVLVDIKMPGKDGLDVAEYIKTREEFKHITTIGISATLVSYETDARTIYLDEFVAKPIDISEILRKISYYLPVIKKVPSKAEAKETEKSASVQENKAEIMSVMKKDIVPGFKEISNTSSFEDYTKFADLLMKKGGEYKIKRLTYLGEAISEATKTFDLEQINLLFMDLKNMIAEFSKDDDG